MRRIRSTLIAAAVFCVGGASRLDAAAIMDASAAMGLTYDFVSRIVSTDQNGSAREQIVLRGSAAILGDKVRIDVDDAGPGSSMNGAYMLALSGGQRLVWVHPGKRQYYEVASAAMLDKMNDLVNGSNGLIKAEASNVKIDVEKVGAGPIMQGQETVHYRVTQKMDMKTKVLHKSSSTNQESTIDYYYAPELGNFVNPFLSSGQDGAESMSFLGAEYMRQVQAAYAKIYQVGAPLKTVISSRSIDEYGNVTTSTATTEVSNLKKGNVSESMFAIPSNYVKVSSMDGATKESAKEPTLSPAGEKAKRAIEELKKKPE